jgi:hypothetical protein
LKKKARFIGISGRFLNFRLPDFWLQLLKMLTPESVLVVEFDLEIWRL